ncbi:MAG: hypothetical protein AAGC93_12870, partial [Cyanobacteria bacterium P01_F01_bin.53]
VEQNLTRMDNEFYHESHYQAGLVISLNLLWCGSFLQLQSIFARLQYIIIIVYSVCSNISLITGDGGLKTCRAILIDLKIVLSFG